MENKKIEQLHGKLIVSCQALPHEPLHSSFIMGRMALAAREGGALGIRANTKEDIREIQSQVNLPVIGIVKRDYEDSKIYITPTMREVQELMEVNPEIIALDATSSVRPGGLTLDDFFRQLKETYPDQLWMADCSTVEEALHADELGFDFIGTTLVGYTEQSKGDKIESNDFEILRKMKDKGCAIIIITHKLQEVLSISDRVTILRKGKSVGTVRTADCDARKLTELMVGRPVSLEIQRPPVKNCETILKVVDLTVDKADGSRAIDDISFDIRRGEILGVAGVAGSGQKELCEAIAGLLHACKGAILFNKENLLGKTPSEIIEKGVSMSFVPEDRLGMGLVASMGMTDNMLLKSYHKGKGPFIRRKPAGELAKRLIEKLAIATPGPETPVRLLSGGNVQKVLLGREIESSPSVLITAYPVRGLDINSSYTVYDLLNEQKSKNVAVMYIGEDLDVLLELSDRIMVLCHGKITGIVDAAKTTKEEIGMMMTGGHKAAVSE